MDFEWNDAKDESNFKKHAVRFAEAVTLLGSIHSVDEHRFIKIGRSIRNRILVVSYCERNVEEIIRIISARKPTKLEVIVYEK